MEACFLVRRPRLRAPSSCWRRARRRPSALARIAAPRARSRMRMARDPRDVRAPQPARIDGKRGSKGGSRRQKSSVPASWTKGKQAAGRLVWWHLLRHTTAASLLCVWWGRKRPLEEVGKLLGRSSTRTTDIDARPLDSALTRVAAETQTAWIREREESPRYGRGTPKMPGNSMNCRAPEPKTGGSNPLWRASSPERGDCQRLWQNPTPPGAAGGAGAATAGGGALASVPTR